MTGYGSTGSVMRVAGAFILLASQVTAADSAPRSPVSDWPHLWGPAGDGISMAQLNPSTTPRVREVWRRKIGSGFSGIAVAGARGYTGESDGNDDHAVAFDVATGRELWRARLGPTYRGHSGSKDGPISTPTADDGRVFIVGPRGGLFALDSATGRVLWQHDLKAEYKAADPVYGFGTSPLIVGNLLVVQVGGETHNLAAFDKKTGKLAWAAAHTKTNGYSSPAFGTLGGRPQIVVHANDSVFGVAPEDGSLLWKQAIDTSEEASRPPIVLPGDRILVGRWADSRLFQVRAEGGQLRASQVWNSPRLRSSYSPPVLKDGSLFGFGGSYLVCVNAEDGSIRWREKVYSGSLILVDGHLVVLGDSSGDLRIVEATPAGYREKVRQPVFNAGATSSTTPSFGSGRILVRNVEEIVALEVI
jgi:outer membrane protein assembly factor BamB